MWTFATVFLFAVSFEGMFTATLSHLIENQQPAVVIAGTVMGPQQLPAFCKRFGVGWHHGFRLGLEN